MVSAMILRGFVFVNRFPKLRLLDFRKIRQKERAAAVELFKSKKGKEILKEIAKTAKAAPHNGASGDASNSKGNWKRIRFKCLNEINWLIWCFSYNSSYRVTSRHTAHSWSHQKRNITVRSGTSYAHSAIRKHSRRYFTAKWQRLVELTDFLSVNTISMKMSYSSNFRSSRARDGYIIRISFGNWEASKILSIQVFFFSLSNKMLKLKWWSESMNCEYRRFADKNMYYLPSNATCNEHYTFRIECWK